MGGTAVHPVLRGANGAAESGAGAVLRLIGYFEGIDSERGIAWRAADSLALRSFLGVGLKEMPPDHSTPSRTRRLIDVQPIKRCSAGCGVAGREESAEGEDDGSGCDDAGGKCRLALDRA